MAVSRQLARWGPMGYAQPAKHLPHFREDVRQLPRLRLRGHVAFQLHCRPHLLRWSGWRQDPARLQFLAGLQAMGCQDPQSLSFAWPRGRGLRRLAQVLHVCSGLGFAGPMLSTTLDCPGAAKRNWPLWLWPLALAFGFGLWLWPRALAFGLCVRGKRQPRPWATVCDAYQHVASLVISVVGGPRPGCCGKGQATHGPSNGAYPITVHMTGPSSSAKHAAQPGPWRTNT